MSESEKATEKDARQPRSSAFSSRRQFIQLGIAALGAAWAGVYLQSKLFPQQVSGQAANPIEFPLSELPVGGYKTITYAGTPGIVIRSPESIKAFSLVCTHMACTVQWQEGNREFYCPCHDGRFDQFGEVTGGPPPVPLEQFPVKIEGERVIVGEVV